MYRCDVCNYNTNRSTNYSRHLKSNKHLKNEHTQNEPTQNENEPTQSRMSRLKTQNEPTQNENEHTQNESIQTQQTVIKESGKNELSFKPQTSDDLLPIFSDEVIESAKHRNKINKRIPQAQRRKIVDGNLDTNTDPEVSKKQSGLGLGILALIVSVIFIIVFLPDIKKFLGSLKLSSGFANNPQGFTIERY